MIRSILIGVLVIGIAGTAYWGYQEHQEKNAILMNAENNYQHAFHDLSYQMDILHDKIGTTLAMNSRKSLSPALADVWRITSEARSQVGQLPLTLLPFNKTEEFLANIGNFSYRTAVRDLDKEPLSKKEYTTLQKLYSQSDDIRSELRNVQHLVLKNNLRWMDVELALASGKEMTDNTIIDGFKTVEKRSKGFSDEHLEDGTMVTFQKKDQNFSHLKGPSISKDDAVSLAKTYAGLKNIHDVKVEENGKGSDYDFYSVNLDNGSDKASLDIAKKGGYPIWLINHRDIGEQKISLNEAASNAKDYLQKHKYQNLELTESTQYDTQGLFTFTTVQDGVTIYPESIKVKVALDNGQVIGFAASDYLKGHHDRNIPKPKLTEKEASGYINENVNIMDHKLAIVANDLGKEVFCHEFIGTMGNDTYRIYINAETGTEEKVEKLQNAESLYEDVV
ncbi:germination protein YpeB [Lederbergia sp. NSJ-179]|uniref:germination protein YpeB n=1 Tax=Lederbergia sp. NSJ-179 TaxID=2931402 RepID=UPI001FD49F56|nr:germination protein YpeB [Lederbergia sp. NSJ-179]MCJ7839443.1 germination protein YpeB [Lederbergia sp. NSJ-179]